MYFQLLKQVNFLYKHIGEMKNELKVTREESLRDIIDKEIEEANKKEETEQQNLNNRIYNMCKGDKIEPFFADNNAHKEICNNIDELEKSDITMANNILEKMKYLILMLQMKNIVLNNSTYLLIHHQNYKFQIQSCKLGNKVRSPNLLVTSLLKSGC
jgi:hypothetical protein